MIFLLFLLLFLRITIESERVQNWLIEKITNNLSRELNTKVEIEHVSFSLVKYLNLDGFYIEDQRGDTLLYAERLEAHVSSNFLDIWNQNIDISDISLNQARVNLYKDTIYSDTNLKFLTEYFTGKKKDKIEKDTTTVSKKRQNTILGISDISLEQFHLIFEDKTKGEIFDAWITEGKVNGLQFDSDSNHLHLDLVKLEKHRFFYTITERQRAAGKKKKKKEKTEKYFTAYIHRIISDEGHFKLDDQVATFRRPKFENTFDFTDIEVTQINGQIDSLHFRNDLRFKGSLSHLSGKEKSGLEILKMKATDAKVNCEEIILNDILIETPSSILGDTIRMSYKKLGYPSFRSFVDDVKIDAKFKKGSKISLKDIFVFAPELQSNKFFNRNEKEVFEIDGEIKGTVNKLRAKNFNLKLGKRLEIHGNLRTKNLTLRGEEFLDLELKQLITSIPTLKSLIPDLKTPEQFDKLGILDFEGRFLGFFTDFVANGYLKTALGNVRSDMNLKGQGNNAAYSGNLELIDFDLAEWTDNPEFGKVNFQAKVKDGVGLDLENLNANLEADVKSFSFKGYNYQFLNIQGNFDSKKFNGKLKIEDNNINLNFDGLVDFNDSIPQFDFRADIDTLKLRDLNLTKKTINLSGLVDLDFKGLNLEDLDGDAEAQNVRILFDTLNLQIDSIYAYSFKEGINERRVGVESEVLNGELIGNFRLDEIHKAVAGYLLKQFPIYSEKIGIKPNTAAYYDEPKYFSFDFFSDDLKAFSKLISPKLYKMSNAEFDGYYTTASDSLKIDMNIENLIYDNIKLTDIVLMGKLEENQGYIDIGAFQTTIDSFFIPNIIVSNTIHSDTIIFGINTFDLADFANDMNFSGKFYPEKDYFNLTFDTSNLVILEEPWDIEEGNFIHIGKDFIETNKFILHNRGSINQSLEINSFDKRGLSLLLNDFEISLLNNFINYDKLILGGTSNIVAKTQDIFKLIDISAKIKMDSFIINNDNFGTFNLNAETTNLQSPLYATLEIKDDEKYLLATGEYYLPNNKLNPNYFDFNFKVKNYPVSIGEYFIGESISDTQGEIDINSSLQGRPNNPVLQGKAYVRNGATTIDYLQNRLFIPNDSIVIRPNLFDLTGVSIYDKEGHKATTEGGIINNKFRQFGLNITVDSDTPNFIGIDTKEEDNESFYGRGSGKITARFSGDFKNTNIEIDATTDDKTNMFLPISDTRTGSELSFITFNKSEDTVVEQLVANELKGLDFNLNVNITPEAEIQLIFDKKTGDILTGKGEGEIELDINREGEMTMYGDYIVEEGKYLFTLLNVVNKPFLIKKGGIISWAGDPLKASIDLEASYDKLSTTPYNFILEYLNSEEEKDVARNATDIDLKMFLKGELFSPEIAFDIDFPSLRGRLKNYTENKLNFIREDKNELNKQVLGLIAFGSFFPSDEGLSGNNLIDGGINTLSELLSSQLSIYLSELLSEVITDVDFDINYSQYEFTDSDANNPVGGSELELRFSKRLFDNRLTINAGSNVNFNRNIDDTEGTNNSSAFLAGDLLIEYKITRDGRFKLRFYQRTEPSVIGRRENRTGVGISYRKEFDSFPELFGKKRKIRTSKKEFNDDINRNKFQ